MTEEGSPDASWLTEGESSDGSWITGLAFWGTFLALFLVPFAFFYFGSIASGVWIIILLGGIVLLCILHLLAIAGLGAEIEGLREEMRRLREERRPTGTASPPSTVD